MHGLDRSIVPARDPRRCPALVIQAWNEYDQRIVREDDIRQRVIEITRQFDEEIGLLREAIGRRPVAQANRMLLSSDLRRRVSDWLL
jgi:hypothetical protein